MKIDTIVAAATPMGHSGAVGIVRLSGPRAKKIAEEVFYSSELNFNSIDPYRMYLGKLTTKNFTDRAFCVCCKAPKSYTGEDVVEFHVHGGLTVIKGVIRELIDRGARPAEAGEFTKRAFLNGKMDLAEAEGIVDIINAESEAEIMQAYRLMSGEVSKTIVNAARLILEAASNLEAGLDYPEELEEDVKAPSLKSLKKARQELSEALKNSEKRRYITDGINIALAGLTNVGKSSLMNALLKDDRAIVTDIPGTTRDVLKESFMLDGIKVNILDTAGIRESSDKVEKIGVEKAKKAIESADLVLFIMDSSIPITEEETSLYSLISHKNHIRVENKGDIIKYPREKDIQISATTGKNIDKLVSLILDKTDVKSTINNQILTRERHIYAVKEAEKSLSSAIKNFNLVTPDCTLVDIKEAYGSLLKITGEDVSESIVDKIFATFCVGK